MLAGSIFGAKRGALASLLFFSLLRLGCLYCLMVVMELVLFYGVASGYLIGFPFAAFFIGLVIELFWQRLNFITLFVINAVGKKVSLLKFFYGFISFLIRDCLKVLIVSFFVLAIKRSVFLIH
ncbi:MULTISPECIES: biotin transporter BioY [unclassified Bartonella]